MRQLLIRNFNAKKDGIATGEITAFLHCLNPQPPEGYEYRGQSNGRELFTDGDGSYFLAKAIFYPGETMYIRETYAERNENGEMSYIYQADVSENDTFLQWRASTQMPIEAARMFLEVMRTEIIRLNDISRDAAKATGARGRNPQQQAREQWDRELTQAIIQERSETNPWVQVVYFRTIPRPADFPPRVRSRRAFDGFNIYTVKDTETGETVASGNAKECALAMGYKSERDFYKLIGRIRDGKCKNYTYQGTKHLDQQDED